MLGLFKIYSTIKMKYHETQNTKYLGRDILRLNYTTISIANK